MKTSFVTIGWGPTNCALLQRWFANRVYKVKIAYHNLAPRAIPGEKSVMGDRWRH